MDVSISDYQNSLRDLRAAREKVRSIVETATKACEAFKGWEQMEPSLVNGSLEKVLQNWPSRGDVESAIREWKKAATLVQANWGELDEEDLLGLQHPTKIDWKPKKD